MTAEADQGLYDFALEAVWVDESSRGVMELRPGDGRLFRVAGFEGLPRFYVSCNRAPQDGAKSRTVESGEPSPGGNC